MKNTKRFFAFILCLSMLLCLVACGGKGNKDAIEMTVLDMTLEDAKAEAAAAGCTPVVISVYDEANEDGAVLSAGEFMADTESGYVTIAVNDLSLKDQVEALHLVPRIIPKSSYEKNIYNKLPDDVKSTFDAYYTLKDKDAASEKEIDTLVNVYPQTESTAIYILDTGVREKDLVTLEGYITENTEYSAEDMFNDYKEVGIVATPSTLLNAEVLNADNCTFEEVDGGIAITLYSGKSQNVVVPAEIDGKAVVALLDGAIPQSTIHALTTESNLTLIDEKAVSSAYGLTNIILADTITDLKYNAFSNALFTTSENDFTVLNGDILLSYTGSEAEVTIPDGIKFVGAQSFIENTAITSVTLPEGVQSIGDSAFKMCANLVNFNIPETTLKVCDSAFYQVRNAADIVIPASVTEIGNYAFFECNNAATITLGENIKKIGDEAFVYCMLATDVNIPDSVEYIGHGAFQKCQALTNVTGGQNVTYVGANVFDEDPWFLGLKEEFNYFSNGILIKYSGEGGDVVLPDDVVCISGAFNGNKRTKTIVVNDGCTTITRNTFSDTAQLKEVTIPASVTTIEDKAFDGGSSILIHCEAGSAAEEYAKANFMQYDNNMG